MAVEPPEKRAIAFVDGQNLFHAVRESFGYPYPNYDVRCLAESICRQNAWGLEQTRFYTGIPDATDDPFWNGFWSGKLAVMGRQGVHVFSRSLRYRNKTVQLPGGATHTFLAGEEKGIDVRIALDVIRLAHLRNYDVAIQWQEAVQSLYNLRAWAFRRARMSIILSLAPCLRPQWTTLSALVKHKENIQETESPGELGILAHWQRSFPRSELNRGGP